MKKWQQEPSELSFDSNGLHCHIKRHPSLLHLCGYVGVAKNHPLFGKDYNELYEMGIDIDIHGGVTYAEPEGDEWVFGFDCAHSGDLVPSSILHGWKDMGDVYRDIEYVTAETEKLAKQLSEIQEQHQNEKA